MGADVSVVNPFNQQAVGSLKQSTAAEVELAMSKAHALHSNRKRWLPPHERIEILHRTIAIMSSQIEELTQLALSEGGKPYVDSKVEVERAINGVQLAMEHISHIKGEQIPMGATQASMNRLAFTMREPIGLVVSVSAFNHPLNLIVHQVIPALAVGCPVVIKPAETTPLSCFKLVEILYEAGLPKEWCTAVLPEREVAQSMVTDQRTRFFSFIGSPPVGWMLQSKLAPGTRSALEHGGAAPVIVDESMFDAGADDKLNAMVDSLTKGGFYHAGQVCVSVQRVFAPTKHAGKLAEMITATAERLVVDDPAKPSTEVGPLITPAEVNRVGSWVDEAASEGATVLCGGKASSETCYQPTVLLNPAEKSNVTQKEIFGPVVCVYGYDSKEDAIAKANSLPFAFQAAVFTEKLDDALKTMQALDATAVMVNDHSAFRVDWMPFGGRKASGIGMGGIPYSMHEMTQEKMMVVKSNVIDF